MNHCLPRCPFGWISTVAVVEELKCHTGRGSEPSLLRVAKRWIKANRLSSSCTNRCCGISPQGQELGRVEAADTTVKGSAGEMTKWRKCQSPRTKLSSCVMWVCFDITAPERLKRCPLVSPAWRVLLLSCLLHLYLSASVRLFIPDVDECGAVTPPCSSGFTCINTVGSYMCNRKIICSRGYHASPDGSRCIGETRHYMSNHILNTDVKSICGQKKMDLCFSVSVTHFEWGCTKTCCLPK